METRDVPIWLTVVLAVMVLALAGCGGSNHAPVVDCDRGTLDTRYCDTDGDLLADPPTEPADLLDPRILNFSYTPVEDPAQYKETWQEFLDHLSEVTGKRVVYFQVQSNAAQIEAMRAGRLHVAGFNTGSVPFAVNVAGFQPFAMMAHDDGSFGYHMEIITRADSGIADVPGLRDKTLAFTSPTSNSGFKAPSALLKSEFNLIADRDFESAFSGKHDNSILGVANGDYDAAAIADEILIRMVGAGLVQRDELRTLYRSDPFPTTAYGHAHSLDPALAEKIREAFFTFDWAGSKMAAAFGDNAGDRFIPITYQEHWEVIRTIDRQNGVEYTSER